MSPRCHGRLGLLAIGAALSELVQEAETVFFAPVFYNLAVLDASDIHAGEPDLPARCRNAHELTQMRSVIVMRAATRSPSAMRPSMIV